MFCKVNEMLTGWFIIMSGIKHGHTLSPELFYIVIKDIVYKDNKMNQSINIGNKKVNSLLYADDIIVLSNTEEELQTMLNTVYAWSMRNMIKLNDRKSTIVHYRIPNIPHTVTTIFLGETYLSVIKQYKYLGIIFDEFVDYNIRANDYNVIVNILADSRKQILVLLSTN